MSPLGVRLKKRGPIFTSPLFKAGHFEVQDEGSQLVAAALEAGPGMKVVDFCAGAGGKTLAVAAAMNNKGRILAWDTSEKRLMQMKERLRRAGVDNVTLHVIETEQDAFIKRHKGTADRVLVDAPCTGTGTWRRNPDAKWRMRPSALAIRQSEQDAALARAASLVKSGGRLVYVTCSMLQEENEERLAAFRTIHADFTPLGARESAIRAGLPELADFANADGTGLLLTPRRTGTDGFFVAVLRRA
jgi:16S rRNA (cytosine967-C5)-methyltransferase